jgi:hypothetical protein
MPSKKIAITPMIIMPTKTMSLLKYLLASKTIQPIPLVAATISAATSVAYVIPIAVLSPVKISGWHDGKIICQRIFRFFAPRESAAFILSIGSF